jgi:hypothetical protein
MTSTDNSLLLNRRRKFKRFDSNLFIEFRPLEGVASYFLGMTKNISCEGFNFTIQKYALEHGQRLEFKLNQPRSNTIISFLGDVIWQEQKGSKYSAGVKFCDVKKKNKKILLKVIADSCNIPFNSLFYSNDSGKLLDDSIIKQVAPASDIIKTKKVNSRISTRQRSKFNWFYRTAFILVTTSALLFLPAIIGNFNGITSKPMAMDNNKHTKGLFTDSNGQTHNSNITDSVQFNTTENINLVEIVYEDIPLTILEKDPNIKLPENIKDMAEETKFHIQVASLKDPEIAHGILSELKQDYPSTYLFIQNDFYKVRIPDIKTSEQGYDLLKNIETKFNLKPILVKRFQ